MPKNKNIFNSVSLYQWITIAALVLAGIRVYVTNEIQTKANTERSKSNARHIVAIESQMHAIDVTIAKMGRSK